MNLAAVLSTSAARLPDKPALLFADTTVSYAALEGRAARASGVLRSLGLSQPAHPHDTGDRVALLLGNSPAFVEAFFGVLRAGLVAVPVNVELTRDEVAHILADSGAAAAIVDPPHAPMVEALRDDVPSLAHVLVAGDTDGRDWDDALADAEPGDLVEVEDDAVALLQYTAGTTGRPKGAMLTHGNLLANHRQMRETRLALEERDVVLCVLPLFHIYALNVVMAFGLSRGATILLVERFDPVDTLREIERHRASVIAGAPPMYVAWMHTPGVEAFDLESVRFAVSGAAPLPPEVLDRFTTVVGVPLWEGYGLTETAPVLTTAATGIAIKPGSVGRPVPGVELRLVAENTRPVREGDPGEVVVRGPNVFAGYWNDPDATRAVLDEAGWFRTGDIGYADADGDLHLVDRKTDLVIVSGFNVYPGEVEAVLHRHPKVAQAAVVGVPHERTGEAVKAYVSLVEGEEATPEELAAFARERLARFKVPETIELVDELPVLPTGKVRRRDLRDA